LSGDFLRHQHSIVHFYIPEVQQRIKLWTNAIPGDIELHADIDLNTFAECFVVSGATICGAVRSAVASMRARNSNTLQLDDFHWGIQSEYQKLNRKLETRDIFKKSLTHNNI
jgi:hypothetical protein